MTFSDQHYMRLAVREARKGQWRTSPNPCVGAVVVRDNEIVGRGFHKKAGTPHAEVHALGAAGKAARGGTLFVTLEPCSHTGRTPPCTEAVLAAGISRVVAGMVDPNPLVAGRGLRFLAERGVEVAGPLLEETCRELNRPFIKHITTGSPWVILKAGASLDGRIAAGAGRQTALTGPESLAEVHRWRHRVDAILVGSGTALTDDPSLTTRLPGRQRGRDPLRVVLDGNLRLAPAARMLSQSSLAATRIYCRPEAPAKRRAALEGAGAQVVAVPAASGPGVDLAAVLADLGSIGVTSLLVEGGAQVHGSFLAAGLADEIFLFTAPRFLGEQGVPLAAFGAEAPVLPRRLQFLGCRRLGEDLLLRGRFSG